MFHTTYQDWKVLESHSEAFQQADSGRTPMTRLALPSSQPTPGHGFMESQIEAAVIHSLVSIPDHWVPSKAKNRVLST